MKHAYLESDFGVNVFNTTCCVPCGQVRSDMHGALLKKGGNCHEGH